MRAIIAIVAALSFCGTATAASYVQQQSHVESYIVSYAKKQAAKHGWTGYEWVALDKVVTRESTWNPCRHYPSTTDCSYAGVNACGIPQRNPCPAAWRGRLWASWREQVHELIRYVRDRYGSPSAAWAWWAGHGTY